MPEPKISPETQSVRGILNVEIKTTKTGASYYQCSVKDILTNAFRSSTNYKKVAPLNGKPVILEYTKRGQYSDFINIEADPNPPEAEPSPPQGEVMTKADWGRKQRLEMREKLIGRAIQAFQLGPSPLTPTIINEWARVFEQYVYEESELIGADIASDSIVAAMARVSEQPEKPPEGKPPKEMGNTEFTATAFTLGFESNTAIREGLGLERGQIWGETKEMALDKLFQLAKANGKFAQYKHWREIK